MKRWCAYCVWILIIYVFFPGLVYASDEPCPKAQFEELTKTLDMATIESVALLAENLTTLLKKISKNCTQDIFVLFREFYYGALHKVYEDKGISEICYPMTDDKRIELTLELERVGWELCVSEGIYCMHETVGWMRTRFGPYLPEPWDEFFQQNDRELKEGFEEDHRLLISWDDLRKRVIAWESFMKKYPDFPLQNEISATIVIYLRVLLTGLDNARIDNWPRDRILKKDVKLVYEVFLKENKESKYFELVKGYYDILKKNKFRTGKQSQEYLKTHRARTILDWKHPPFYWEND